MALNKAYLQAGHCYGGDEYMTPFYAVEPLLKYIPKDKKIWCPFDKEWSAFVQTFKENGYTVYNTHIDNGQDFFNYRTDFDYDLIVSNPPFSKKNEVLKRLYEIKKPFIMLLPIQSLQSKERTSLFKEYGLQLIIFGERVDYHTRGNLQQVTKGCHFGSAYFCWNILSNNLVFESLNKKYERALV